MVPSTVRFADCHPDRKHRARGLCEECYARWKRAKRDGKVMVDEAGQSWIRADRANDVMPEPSLDELEHPRPKPSQVDRPDQKPRKLRLANPRVAFHVAKCVLMSKMDYAAAVDLLEPDAPNKNALIDEIEKSEEVQAALGKLLKAKGLDDDSKDVYVETLWEWLHGEDEMRATTAARLLGKALIPEKSETKLEDLRVQGFEEGLAAMLKNNDEGEE